LYVLAGAEIDRVERATVTDTRRKRTINQG